MSSLPPRRRASTARRAAWRAAGRAACRAAGRAACRAAGRAASAARRLARHPFAIAAALAAGAAVIALLAPTDALARPGGGHGYSGGGGGVGGGGGGGGGGGDGLFFLIWLIFRYPAIGIPVAIVVAIVWFRQKAKAPSGRRDDLDMVHRLRMQRMPPPAPAADLERVRTVDRDFSSQLFLDFAFELFAKAHEARDSKAQLDALAPWLSEPARRHLAARQPAGAEVTGVVVGSIVASSVRVPPGAAAHGFGGGEHGPPPLPTRTALAPPPKANQSPPPGASPSTPPGASPATVPAGGAGRSRIVLEIEANVTTRAAARATTRAAARATTHAAKRGGDGDDGNGNGDGGDGGDQSWYVRERWTLERDATATTRAPEDVRSFHCPSCGAPFETTDGATCEYCGEIVTDGRFDWTVMSISVIEQQPRPPSLRGHAPERGTLAGSIVHPELDERLAALRADDPELTDAAFDARLSLIHQELNRAWSRRDLAAARPYVTDALWNYLSYWIAAYREQGLVNLVESPTITRWLPVKVVRDRWHEAIVVRVWQNGYDVTLDERTKEIVGGSRDVPRPFSEYWTLVRRRGVTGAPRSDRACPNCGAPIDHVNAAGTCENCGSHVTSGEFDWVLSRIEQDESYRG